jgi:glyoxylase-like metal-dependent hydrolase (beta-lactamase superfamily II)
MSGTTIESATDVKGLHATRAETMSFAPKFEIRSFLLEREAGNLLIYSTGRLAEDSDDLAALGGVERQYLNHWHEAGFGLAPDSLGATLLYHEAEAPHIADAGGSGETFDSRHRVDDDFEVIPTPGHTTGATAYLWDNGEHRVLFTGDTITINKGKWQAAVLPSSDRDAFVATLELVRELDFDILVPWAAAIGGPHLAIVDGRERRERIDKLIDWVRKGNTVGG